MKRIPLLLVLGVVVFAASARAQTLNATFLQSSQTTVPTAPAPPVPTQTILQKSAPTFPSTAKIAFINLQTIAQESIAGKAAASQLKKFQDTKLLEIQSKSQAVKALQDKQTGSTVLTAPAAAQVQKDLDRAQMDLQYAQQAAQKEFDDLQRELMTAFSDRVAPVVEQVRAERELWAVWAIDESLAALMPGLDVSLEVVRRLDALK